MCPPGAPAPLLESKHFFSHFSLWVGFPIALARARLHYYFLEQIDYYQPACITWVVVASWWVPSPQNVFRSLASSRYIHLIPRMHKSLSLHPAPCRCHGNATKPQEAFSESDSRSFLAGPGHEPCMGGCYRRCEAAEGRVQCSLHSGGCPQPHLPCINCYLIGLGHII